MKYVWAYIATGLVFLPLDLLCLAVIARDFYRNNFGDLIAEPFNIPAAVLFYFIYILGIVIFAVGPAINKQSFAYAVLYGALFGFFCYATYDLTNLATLKNFPAKVVPVDILWGTVLTSATAAGGYALSSLFIKS